MRAIIFLIALLLIVVVPLAMRTDAKFEGADGEAQEMIIAIQPEYKPWFSNFIELPSGEIESLLFAVQSALGAGVIAYYLGYNKGKKGRKADATN